MRIRTDDEVYRVDAVWLGPPKATFPWRARYVAWGVGIPLFLVTLGVERQLGFGFGFFTTAWAFVITIALTRLITSKISHERPLGAVFAMWMRELQAPREKSAGTGGAASASKIKVRTDRPRPKRARGTARRTGHRPAGPGRAVSTASPVIYPSRETTARARRRRSSAPVGR
ncbi:hypothetical protein [Prauserella cavernicola]|uniref:Uncharacterized protein n=1 Tax=Prauserella cavernicola TaxID=2800127 RepID=A0A934QYC7_9PSEU|nr:hypothetical protein [Prauserella cavernicola]MBK1789000.1 hypothetical protein [Prauserella cavernicola]